MPKKKNIDNEVKEIDDSAQKIMAEVIEDKTAHFNHINVEKYKTSTGSFNFDLELNGGIEPCILRCGGPAEAGKTSFSLNLMRIFLMQPNRRGIYFLSDKEVTKELIDRVGVKFVEDFDQWEDGTCFILRTNIYETVCNTIRKLLSQTSKLYCFVLDSMDNFSPKAALQVDFGESSQKGGTSAITSHFFRCYNILLPRSGHLTILISQERDTFTISRYQKATPKQFNSSGGRAMEHAATWAFEFELAVGKDILWSGEPHKSEKLGHNCIINLKKSTNEKTGNVIRFPIKHNRIGGNSIWLERELCDQLLAWEMIKKKKSWLVFSDIVKSECNEKNIEIKEQIQGYNNLLAYLEENKKLTKYLTEKFKELIS